ncbi:uncharacterized protein LOC126906627 [Daktulosphaira vitifoliae]|uniref:uncharacterized protein LOC126906627 n=1 Tax=Daktulosphaira vitifoliae TaxID=58002 RepID=UPI0021A9D616|nr:uncharacterized protein LOC126906627 [Daktulosphaira vitifoliae]
MIAKFDLILILFIFLETTKAGCMCKSSQSDVAYQFPCKATKLMLKYFLNLIQYFNTIFDIDNPQLSSIADLRAHGNSIQFCGKLTMLILDELRNKYNFQHHDHLMVINLYLNNTSEIEIMYKKPNKNKNPPKIDLDKVKKILVELKNGQNMIVKNLSSLIKNMCVNYADGNSINKVIKNGMSKITKRISFKSGVELKIFTLKNTLARNRLKIRKLVKKRERDYRYLDFHPINLLFFKLLSKNKINDNVIKILTTDKNIHNYINVPYETNDETVDSLNLISNIKILNNTGVTVTLEKLLSDYMVFNYNTAIMNEFHKIVFAATIQPFFVAIETYYYMISITLPNKDIKKNLIYDIGNTLNKCFEKFIQLNIFPSYISNDLKDIMKYSIFFVNQMELNNVVVNNLKKFKKFKKFSKTMTNMMNIDNIEYNIPIKSCAYENISDLIEVIQKVKNQIEKLVWYVETLKKYTNVYKTVLRVIPPNFNANNRVPINIIDYYQSIKTQVQ